MAWNVVKNSMGFTASIFRKRLIHVLVQVTNRCNMTCDFCDFWPNGVPAKDELSLADYEKIANQLAELGTCVVSIEGGEPLIRKDLVQIVRIFAKQHLPVLYTNGWFVTAEIAAELFEAGLTQAAVSIDFPTADKHDTKRGRTGAYEKAWQAIEYFKNAAKSPEKQVQVISVLMRDNQDAMDELLRLSGQKGVGHSLTLIALEGFRRGKGENQLPEYPFSEKLMSLWKKYPHFKMFRSYIQGIDSFTQGKDLPKCLAGKQSINIDHVGNVSACIEKIDDAVGNVTDTDLKVLVQRTSESAKVAQCQDCWSQCRGFHQALSNGASASNLIDLSGRMRAM